MPRIVHRWRPVNNIDFFFYFQIYIELKMERFDILLTFVRNERARDRQREYQII